MAEVDDGRAGGERQVEQVVIDSPFLCSGVYGDQKRKDVSANIGRTDDKLRGFVLGCTDYNPETHTCSNTIGDDKSLPCLFGYAVYRCNTRPRVVTSMST
ncbi:MAG: hypothetical protein KKB31_01140 [Nanoarchaeota archaeon]|nr:hypothetical protein [Nanoarchaeota archaeon]